MSYLDKANEVDLEYVVNSKGVKFNLQDRVQYARAFLYACKALGVDVMSMYSVTPYLAEGKTLASGYEWFGDYIASRMDEGAYILHVDDAKAFKALVDEHKAQAKANKPKAEPKAQTQVIAGKRPADAHVGTTVRMSITPSGKVTLDAGKGKSTLKASQKARLADLAAALKALSQDEREYLQALMA